MHKYLIQYEVKTPASLFDPFNYHGFSFRPWQPNEVLDKWIVEKTVEAENYTQAYNLFIKELIPVASRLSVSSQCSFQLRGRSFLVYRTDNNSTQNIYINYTQPRDVVGLPFDKPEIENLPKLESIERIGALIYLQEASEAITPYTRLVMLIMASEGLAGEKEGAKGYPTTDKIKLKGIIGTELFQKLYAEDRIRHKVFHGKEVDDSIIGQLNEPLYQNLLVYLSKEYSLEFTPAVNAPRGFYGEYERSGHFYRLSNSGNPDLKEICEILYDYFNEPSKESIERFRSFFDENITMPNDY